MKHTHTVRHRQAVNHVATVPDRRRIYPFETKLRAAMQGIAVAAALCPVVPAAAWYWINHPGRNDMAFVWLISILGCTSSTLFCIGLAGKIYKRLLPCNGRTIVGEQSTETLDEFEFDTHQPDPLPAARRRGQVEIIKESLPSTQRPSLRQRDR